MIIMIEQIQKSVLACHHRRGKMSHFFYKKIGVIKFYILQINGFF